jgi:hypothetical protein
MRELSILAFEKACKACIEKKTDFVLICGDLFNTPLPDIELLERTIRSLQKLKQNKIEVYLIAGSHDFSASNKTFLRILSGIDLIKNATRLADAGPEKMALEFLNDEKTGAKITGLLGRRNALDIELYQDLDKSPLEQEKGFKIFMFHNAVSEIIPKKFSKVPGIPLSLFPKGFDYYAGGHIHYIDEKDIEDFGKFVYPGPLFPSNFDELKEMVSGGFFIAEVGNPDSGRPEISMERQKIMLKNVRCFDFDCEGKKPEEINSEVYSAIEGEEFFDTIVLMSFRGKISGSLRGISFSDFSKIAERKSAFFVMRSTSKLESSEFKELFVENRTPEEIESEIISFNLGKLFDDKEKERQLIQSLISVLSLDKSELEKEKQFQERLLHNLKSLFSF